MVLAGISAVLVDLCDGDLHRGVVLGLDDSVGGRALSWDVAVLCISYCGSEIWGKREAGLTDLRVRRVRFPW